MGVFERILDGRTEEAVKLARESVQRALDCKVSIEDLVISRTGEIFQLLQGPGQSSECPGSEENDRAGIRLHTGNEGLLDRY